MKPKHSTKTFSKVLLTTMLIACVTLNAPAKTPVHYFQDGEKMPAQKMDNMNKMDKKGKRKMSRMEKKKMIKMSKTTKMDKM